MTLAARRYEYDANGRMIKLYCPVCGVLIAEDRRGNFWRFPEYCEMKMQFADRSKHVTNVCTTCLPIVSDSRELMFEIYQADIDDMARALPELMLQKFKFGPRFVEAELTKSGLP